MTRINYGRGVMVLLDEENSKIYVKLKGSDALGAMVDGTALLLSGEPGVWLDEANLAVTLPNVAKAWPKIRVKILADTEKHKAA